jgi:hypothetical protein
MNLKDKIHLQGGGNVMIQTNNGVKHWDSMQSGVLMRISMCKRYRCGRLLGWMRIRSSWLIRIRLSISSRFKQ